MKKNLSKLLIMLMLVMSTAIFAGCGSSDPEKESVASDDVKKIGIIQIVEHPSLDTIRKSIIAELAAEGFVDGENITIDYQNAQNDPTNLKTISQKFVTNGYDLIIAIATPSAQSVLGETSDIPIIFAACTDPIAAGLVTDLNAPGGNITGTSDYVSAEKIMELGLKITPNIKTIGALYSSSEPNSLPVIEDLEAYAATKGFTVVRATVTNSSEVQQAAASLVGKVDSIFIPIDNTVASAMQIVSKIANEAKLPLYVSADSMVKDGGLATYGINYEILGKETATMVVAVLNGTKPGDIAVKTMDDMDIYVNQKTATAINATIPADVLSQATILGE